MVTPRRVAIHQPVFLPWLGFFVKLAKCDVFVLLEHCEINPRTACLCNRVRIQLPGSVNWLGVPLVRPEGRIGVPVDEMEINLRDPRRFRRALRSIEQAYRRAPFFSAVFPLAQRYFEASEPSLSARNMGFVDAVLEGLDITPLRARSRSLGCPHRGGEMLADIVTRVGGTVYVSGDGGRDYQSPESFSRRGIRLAYNHFVAEPYPRVHGRWEPGLSILDALMNLGFEGTRALVRRAVRTSEARARAVGEAVDP